MDINERAARVKEMEEAYDRLRAAVDELAGALEGIRDAGPLAEKLSAYLDGTWREDYEADERGELPADLKHGVLGQDALYDLMADYDEIMKELNL